jgi:glycosyltransferase involved in cell wall biosynthesis
MTAPFISVIIPVKNAGAVFKECLVSVTSNHETDFEVIVVDDHSTDNSGELARQYACQVITLPRSFGPSRARNIGAQAAKGEILLFIDSDIIVSPDTLRKVRLIFQDRNIIAIVGVLSDEIRYKNFCSQYKNLWMRYTYIRMPETVSLFYTSGAAIRREIFLKSGGFDTNYTRPSVEDTDFAQKLDLMGYKAHLRRDIELEHVKYYSIFEIYKTDFYRAAGLLKMTLRNGFKRFLRRNKTSVPSTFIIGVFLFFSSVLISVIGFFSPLTRIFCFLYYLLFVLVVPFLFSSFLAWLTNCRGRWFMIRAMLFMFLDIPVVALGIIFGLLEYVRGKKY